MCTYNSLLVPDSFRMNRKKLYQYSMDRKDDTFEID